MRRVVVLGTSGSGKTTFASKLARRLGIPHVELDAIRHQVGWVELPDDLFRDRIRGVAATERWVVDGNYGGVGTRDILWPRAATIVWLDTPLAVNLWRVTRRSVKRIITREVLWNGNRESARSFFFSRDSLFVWVLRGHRRRRRELPRQLARPEWAHLRVYRFARAGDAERWLATVRSERPAGRSGRA